MSIDTKPPPAKTAAEICRKFELSQPAAGLLREGLQPRAFLDLLIQKEHFADTVRFLANTMAPREAVWWACLCSRPEKGVQATAPVAAAQQAAEAWVAQPDDKKRRAAHAAATPAGMGTPIGLTCLAIFFAEGSMGPPDLQVVPAPEGLAVSTAANAIILAGVADPTKAPAKFRRLLSLGDEVAAGKNRWKPAADAKK